MRSVLLRMSRFMYSQTIEKKNVFKLPLKHQFKAQALSQTSSAIATARSCNILAITFRDNISFFTETHLYQLYSHLHQYKLTIDNSFHQIIAPISLQYVKVFNREHAPTMYQMLLTIIDLNIDTPHLKESLLNKLDNENCYRYIPLYQTAILLNKLLESQQNSKLGLTRKLITVLHQQKAFYNYFQITKPVVSEILQKLEKLQRTQPQLTQAYKQIK